MFKIDNWGSDTSNAKGMMAGQRYYRYFNEENNDITASGYFPANLCLEKGDRIVVIPSDTDNADELYVVTAVSAGVATIAKATSVVNGVVPQYSTMPTASAYNLGEIVQFTGTTDANYTNGYFYKCTAAGEPAVYSWTQANVQPAPSGLPDQTGNSGKFLTTDGTDASWATVNALQNTATGSHGLTILGTPNNKNTAINIGYESVVKSEGIAIGDHANAAGSLTGTTIAIGPYAECSNGNYKIAIGSNAKSTSGTYSIAIGTSATCNADRSIQLGSGTNTEDASFYVSVGMTPSYNPANYKLLGNGGFIPADRLASTTGLADGNYKLRLTIASGVATLSWVAE